jgi:DNA modification methylase
MDNFILKHGDCCELLKEIPDNSIDMVLTDPPYGNMNGVIGIDGWDNHLNWELVFNELLRICKYSTNILLFAQDELTIKLIKQPHNNIDYCHRLIWDKGRASQVLGASKAPLNHTEDILVFRKQYDTNYNSEIRNYARSLLAFIGKTSKQIEKDLGDRSAEHFFRTETTQHTGLSERCYNRLIELYSIDKFENFLKYEDLKKIEIKKDTTFNIPKNQAYVPNVIRGRDTKAVKYHPTEKPVGLLEQLLLIYSNPNDTILDFTMGSGSTGVACKSTSRNFIGIEMDLDFFNIAKNRIETSLF